MYFCVCVCVCWTLTFLCVCVSWPSRPGCDRDRAVWALTDRGCLHQPIVCHSLIMFIDLWQKHNLMEWGEVGRGGGEEEMWGLS